MWKPWIGLILIVVACGGDDTEVTDAATEPDAAMPCTELEVGCACSDEGESMCRMPGPDLLCSGGVWLAAYDGPCPGLDLGPGRDFGT